MNGNGSSSSRSGQQLVTPAAGKLPGLLSGGAGGGDKSPRQPRRMKSVHELDAAGSGSKRPVIPTVPAGEDEWESFRCSSCESSFISQEDLHCHIRRCHVPRSWRRGNEDAPWPPPPSVAEKRLLLGGSSSRTSKKGCSVVSKQEQQQKQQADVAAEPEVPAAVPATPVVELSFDLNVPVPEVEEEKGSSG